MNPTALAGDAILLSAVVVIGALEVRRHRRRARQRGQALVEMALVTPILLAILLGLGEAASLYAARTTYQNAAETLASWLAGHEGVEGEEWEAVAASETARVGCDASPSIAWPDGAPGPSTRLVVSLSCPYVPRITSNVWHGLVVGVEASSVTPAATPTPAPTPSPEPTATVAP
jgi:hypothetical protein